ncbi:uncharacterized protein LOC113327930 [Papaver somniferum]|uniref:uncharacterized protein LOC113327930 n=1 Tax=Papaver somniferum TaxID=3469 RepID=UPI000E6FF015|nr:uncharacterized protein LOC113327930 [Papaver somniferum]
MANYQMSTFKIPKTTIEEMNKIQRNFFWGKVKGKPKGVFLKAWTGVCKPLEEGGLDFVNLEKFNSAIISKMGWRITKQPNSIGSQVMKAKYFEKVDIMHMSPIPKPTDSWVWKDIPSGIANIQDYEKWEVGSGVNIDIWQDNWIKIFEDPVSKPNNCPIGVNKVADLFAENQQWNRPLIHSLFANFIANKIINTDIKVGHDDKVKWSLTKDGKFTITHLPTEEQGGQSLAKESPML